MDFRGLWRLGSEILLNFETDDDPELPDGAVRPRRSRVDLYFRVRGPCYGSFSSHVAQRNAEAAISVCAFAIGRPLVGSVTHISAPISEIGQLQHEQLDNLRLRSDIRPLCRKGVSLDLWSSLDSPGGLEAHTRVTTAIRTFDAASRQERSDVALILLTSAAESLVVPHTNWRKNKVTTRFIEFMVGLIPDAIDELVQHGNAEEVFGFSRGNKAPKTLRREFAERIYHLRSHPLHSGLPPGEGYNVMAMVDWQRGVRRTLVAAFVEAAILAYIESPRSSIIGLPG